MEFTESMERLARLLAKVPLFSGLNDRQLRGLVRTAKERSYPEGTTIVKQGESGIGLYLIVEGKVDVRRRSRKLATFGAGHFFGETALFGDTPRTADVIAAEPTRCLVLSRWEFWGFSMARPEILRGMLEEMARRLAETDKALSD